MNTYRGTSKYAGTAILPLRALSKQLFPHRDIVYACVNRQQ